MNTLAMTHRFYFSRYPQQTPHHPVDARFLGGWAGVAAKHPATLSLFLLHLTQRLVPERESETHVLLSPATILQQGIGFVSAHCAPQSHAGSLHNQSPRWWRQMRWRHAWWWHISEGHEFQQVFQDIGFGFSLFLVLRIFSSTAESTKMSEDNYW